MLYSNLRNHSKSIFRLATDKWDRNCRHWHRNCVPCSRNWPVHVETHDDTMKSTVFAIVRSRTLCECRKRIGEYPKWNRDEAEALTWAVWKALWRNHYWTCLSVESPRRCPLQWNDPKFSNCSSIRSIPNRTIVPTSRCTQSALVRSHRISRRHRCLRVPSFVVPAVAFGVHIVCAHCKKFARDQPRGRDRKNTLQSMMDKLDSRRVPSMVVSRQNES